VRPARWLLGCLALAAALWPAAPAAALTADSSLAASLARSMRPAGGGSGAIVVDETDGRVLFALRPDTPRVPASNQKLYTTSTALLRYGPGGTLSTRVLGVGTRDSTGTFTGTLYLRGGGDPTFGSASFTRRAYGTGGTASDLAGHLAAAGIRRVRGSVMGDESAFDRRRGGSGFGIALDIGGPLSALSFNRGLATESGGGFQRRPATYAAAQLTAALRSRGIAVTGAAGERLTPPGARELAREPSPAMSTLVALTNRPSDNFFAEMLLKDLGASFLHRGTTAGGAAVVRGRMAQLGIHPRVADGSGLSRGNRTTPRDVVRLLTAMDHTPAVASALRNSLSVAGRSGTLAPRMRGTVAAGRCRGKTGTLSGVSALSGYCDAVGGRRLAFSILMNGVSVSAGRAIQNAMAVAIARYPVSRSG
jgi:serine-type D-Ala-D-Ala carboxypeptidase/endopeptidase (penicillin-binding protein 4)